MKTILEMLDTLKKNDLKQYKEIMKYCETRISAEEGIPAVIGLDDLTASWDTIYEGAKEDKDRHMLMAVGALIFASMYESPAIAPAMSAVAEMFFPFPENRIEENFNLEQEEGEFAAEEFIKVIAKDKRTLEMFRYLIHNSYLRVVNYHNTNPINAVRFEEEIKYFSENFVSVRLKDLETFFETKKWPYDKPGVIPAIFEGFRNHYDVMLPILDKYNVKGWFYLPSFFMDVPIEKQIPYSEEHELDVSDKELYPDKRVAMTWEEVREIAKKHEICCHTGNHFQITKETSDEDMYREIVESKRLLEEKIGRDVDVFCWLYGEEYSYNTKAHKYLKEAGYKYVVSNLKLEKIK